MSQLQFWPIFTEGFTFSWFKKYINYYTLSVPLLFGVTRAAVAGGVRENGLPGASEPKASGCHGHREPAAATGGDPAHTPTHASSGA